MAWWDELWRRLRASDPPRARGASEQTDVTSGPDAGRGRSAPTETAKWLPAEDNPFGLPVLDLASVTGDLVSTSRSVSEAETAISWDRKTVADLAEDMHVARSIECQLSYPAEEDLPDGWLFTPSRMEEKWVLGYRSGRILLARSWSGDLKASAAARHDGPRLIIERIDLADDSLAVFGDPVQAFDWLVRSHALEQALPLPVHVDGAKLLESVPLAVFGPFGAPAAYAATSWDPPLPRRPLRATSALVTAVRLRQSQRIVELAHDGCSLDARSAFQGFTALHFAAAHGNVALTRLLLELGANPNVSAGRSALVTAVIFGAPIEVLELLAEYGADVAATDEGGYGALHMLATVNRPEPLPWLLAQGLDLDERTKKTGHTPLHLAAALGRVEALVALLAAGADPEVKSEDGQTAREIAVANRWDEPVKVLDGWVTPS